MPVKTNKYNQMVEHFNIIRDQLDAPVPSMRKLTNYIEEARTDEDISYVTIDIISMTVYYIMDVVQTNHRHMRDQKLEYLSEILENVNNIIRSRSPTKKQDFRQVYTQCVIDNPESDYKDLAEITKTITEGAIKLLYYTRSEGLEPDLYSSDSDQEDEADTSNNEDSENSSEEGQPGEQENDLYLPD